MFSCFATVNFNTEFRVPPDCFPEGDVTCRVIRAECDVVDKWDQWVTIKIRLLLKITIQSGQLICSFTKEVVVKETVWLDGDSLIKECDVVAAACRCVVHRGRVICNVTVKVEFFLKKRRFDDCKVVCERPKRHHLRRRDDCDDWDDWDDASCDWHKDDDIRRPRAKVQVIQCKPKPCQRFFIS